MNLRGLQLGLLLGLELWAACDSSEAPPAELDAGTSGDAGPLPCEEGQARGPWGCAPLAAESCPAGQRPELGRADCVPVGVPTCPGGFVADPSGLGCAPILANSCGPGTRAQLGQEGCVPVGFTTCPDGFVLAEDGWGCTARLPRPACAEGRRDAIGAGSCSPIGDCAAPFPPEVTRWVDPTRAEDGTHHHGLTAAIQAAAPGEVIAVEAGSYTDEGLRLDKPLTLIGRCAEQVLLNGTGTVPGLGITADGVVVRGFTLIGHRPGILVAQGAEAELHDLQITAPVTAGLLALHAGTLAHASGLRIDRASALGQTPGVGVQVQRGARAELLDVEVVGSSGYGFVVLEAGSTLTATRAVIRQVNLVSAGGAGGQGVVIGEGTEGQLYQSTIRDTARGGLVAQGGVLRGRGLELVDSGRSRPSDAAGINANGGGRVELSDVRISAARLTGAGAFDGGSALSLTRATISAGQVGANGLGLGLIVQGNANVELLDSAIVGQPSSAVAAFRGALTVRGSLLGPGSEPQASALLVDGTRLSVEDSELHAPMANAYNLDVRGASAQAEATRVILRGGPSAVFDGAQLIFRDGAILDSWDFGFFVGSSMTGVESRGRLELIGSVLARNISTSDPAGAGGVLLADQSSALIDGCTFLDNNGSALYVDAAASLEVKGSVLRGTLRSSEQTKGVGLEVWGRAIVSDSALVSNGGGGIIVRGSGTATVTRSVFDHNRLLGAFVDYEARLALSDSALLEQQPVEAPKTAETYGFGGLFGGDAHLQRVLIRGNHYAGLGLGSFRHPQTQVRVEESVIQGTRADGTSYGHGILAAACTLWVSDSWIVGNERVGLVFSAATGAVERTVIGGNAVGIHTQDGTALRDLPELPAELTPMEAVFSADVVFVDNGTKVGVGQLPLPPGLDEELGQQRPPRTGN